jgi:hypothetical protein
MTKFKALLDKIHFLPAEKSFKWIYVLGIVFAVNFATLLISRVLLNLTMTSANILAFAGVSLGIGLVVCLGYFGVEIFSLMVLAGNAMGVIYLFFIILTNASQGWSDLTSIIGLLYFVAMGVMFGFMMQLIYFLSKVRFKRRR